MLCCCRLLLLVGLQAVVVGLSLSVPAFSAAGLVRTTRGSLTRGGWSTSAALASGEEGPEKVRRVQQGSRTALWSGAGDQGSPGEPGLKDIMELMDRNFRTIYAGINGIDERMNREFGRLDERMDRMDKEFDRLDERMDKEFDRMDKEFDRLDERMNKELGRISRQLGWAAEGRARTLAVNLLGRDYARSLVARSILDLLLFFPVGEDQVISSFEWGRRALEVVVHDRVPERLLGCVSSKLEKFDGATPCIKADGTVDFQSLGRFIGRCDDDSTRIPLMKIRDVLVLTDEQERVEALLRCHSAGLMCVTAAAHAGLYLDCGTPYLFPPELLEFDMRGRVEFPAHEPRFAYIDIGEVKVTVGFKEAVEQLGLRLGVLKWLVLQSQPNHHLETDIRLVGRLFGGWSSVDNRGDSRVPVDMMDRAEKEWGFSLYMHLFDG